MADDTSPQSSPRLFPDEQDPFYRFFQSAPILLAITTFSEGRYIEINRMFLRTLGLSRSAVIGKTSTELGLWVNPSDRARLKERLSQSFRVFLPEIQVRTGDGIIRHMIFSAERIEVEGNFCLFTAAQDITSRKHSENVLLQMEKLKSIERVVGSMAFDYDLLLAEALNGLSLAQSRGATGMPASSGLEKARTALSEMAELTRKFKFFAEQGISDSRRVPIKSILEASVTRAARDVELTVSFMLPSELPAVVINTEQFDQMCRALVCNAAEAMTAEGGVLRVFASEVVIESDQVEFGFRITAGHYVKLSFADNGSGIAGGDIPKVFDPYFSTKSAVDQKAKGLGLAMVHSIVCRHNGCMSVTSKAHAGTLFNVYLPAAAEPPAMAEDPPRVRRVLVEDQETGFPEELVTTLFAHGIVCDRVGPGASLREAFARAGSSGGGYDAVVLGRLPEGETQIKARVGKLKEVAPDAVCLAAIEYGDFDYVPDHQVYGFAGVVRKPYRLSNLLAVFSRLFAEVSDSPKKKP